MFAALSPNVMELVTSDGTPAGTRVSGHWALELRTMVTDLAECDGRLQVEAHDIWPRRFVTDGAHAGTGELPISDKHSCKLESLWKRRSTSIGGVTYYVNDDGVHGRELWKVDATGGEPSMVRDLWPGPLGSDPQHLTVIADRWLVFAADDGVTGEEAWVTDGTATFRLTDLDPGRGSSRPHAFARLGDRLIFAAVRQVGLELWQMPLGALAAPPLSSP